MKVVDMTGKEVEVHDCLGCEISKGKLDVFGGLLFKGKSFSVAQDFELPINGFLIIFSNRHVEKLNELDFDEQIELTKLVSKTLKILQENHVAEEYNLILEEKKGYHFHVWLMPRHKWMIERFGKVLKNIKQIEDYAISSMKTEENFEEIKRTCDLVRTQLNKEKI